MNGDGDSGERVNPYFDKTGDYLYTFGYSRILYFTGRAVQIFLSLYFGLIAAVGSFVVSMFIGYTAWDRYTVWSRNTGCDRWVHGMGATVHFVESDDERIMFVAAQKK